MKTMQITTIAASMALIFACGSSPRRPRVKSPQPLQPRWNNHKNRCNLP
jgi:outer membrane biogenesis lipoprotein LolB